jgi:hypothetical protein
MRPLHESPWKIWAIALVTAAIASWVGFDFGRELARQRPQIIINLGAQK